jgi:hypothetical protein
MTPITSTTGPESIVTSLDWSKKLKEAGWSQEGSTFYWQEHQPTHEFHVWFRDVLHLSEVKVPGLCFAAPTAEEILRRLPKDITKNDGSCYALEVYFCAEDGNCLVYKPMIRGQIMQLADAANKDSLANAAAAMWVYLSEQKLLPSS